MHPVPERELCDALLEFMEVLGYSENRDKK
jgi:hypothetical protein